MESVHVSLRVELLLALYGVGPPVSERSSQQPGGTPQRNANDTTSRAETSTTATQQGSISANPFATLFSQILGSAGQLGQMAAATAGSTANAPSSGGEVGFVISHLS